MLKAQWREAPGQLRRSPHFDEAARLLRTINQTVAQIAWAVGYGSHQSLGLAFKKHFGQLPLQYRRQNERVPR